MEFAFSEDRFHQQYDDLKLPFEPCPLLTITMLGFRNVSVGYSDYVDTPDPEFRIKCPKIKRPHLSSFKTSQIPSNVTKGYVGETFKFVIPRDHPSNEPFPVKITLVDVDVGPDDVIGSQTFDAMTIPEDGSWVSKTLVFGKKNGELDITINRAIRTSPDFRYSLGLCLEERAYRKKRLPKVCEALKKVLGDKAPQNVMETPIVSLVGSGGGYRAIVGMCGAMEALKDAGLLDALTYNCGLSGSSWYLATAYTMQGVKADQQKEFHETVRKRFTKNLIQDMVNPFTIQSYEHHLKDSSRKFGQPYTFVNYFPGYLVGKQLLEKKMEQKLSDMIPYVASGDVPFPVLVALHVKNKLKASQYHAYIERTPYEISMPSYGISVKTVNEGSTWNNGFLVKAYPEFPIHFTIGMTGCAFSILLNSYLGSGGELDKDFVKFVEKERLEGKQKANKDLDETGRAAEIESEDSEDDDDDDVHVHEWKPEDPKPEKPNNGETAAAVADGAAVLGTDPALPKEQQTPIIKKLISSFTLCCHTPCPAAVQPPGQHKKTTFFSTRNGIVGRTARVYNFALGLEKVERHLLNPLKRESHSGNQSSIIDAFGVEKVEGQLSTTKNVISFADAGVLKNVPTDVILRPQRRTDVMIVMDFNGYKSDTCFDWAPLLAAAAQAWQCGLEFPEIDFKKITNMPPTDFLLFPSHGPRCPTVIWITLSHCKFKLLKDYKPRSTAKPPKCDTRKFNDFQVFGKGSPFSTFNFQYSNYNFDQLRELMYYNVTNHIEEIKDALAKATIRKRKRYEAGDL